MFKLWWNAGLYLMALLSMVVSIAHAWLNHYDVATYHLVMASFLYFTARLNTNA